MPLNQPRSAPEVGLRGGKRGRLQPRELAPDARQQRRRAPGAARRGARAQQRRELVLRQVQARRADVRLHLAVAPQPNNDMGVHRPPVGWKKNERESPQKCKHALQQTRPFAVSMDMLASIAAAGGRAALSVKACDPACCVSTTKCAVAPEPAKVTLPTSDPNNITAPLHNLYAASSLPIAAADLVCKNIQQDQKGACLECLVHLAGRAVALQRRHKGAQARRQRLGCQELLRSRIRIVWAARHGRHARQRCVRHLRAQHRYGDYGEIAWPPCAPALCTPSVRAAQLLLLTVSRFHSRFVAHVRVVYIEAPAQNKRKHNEMLPLLPGSLSTETRPFSGYLPTPPLAQVEPR